LFRFCYLIYVSFLGGWVFSEWALGHFLGLCVTTESHDQARRGDTKRRALYLCSSLCCCLSSPSALVPCYLLLPPAPRLVLYSCFLAGASQRETGSSPRNQASSLLSSPLFHAPARAAVPPETALSHGPPSSSPPSPCRAPSSLLLVLSSQHRH
jgi:hypothetical protein